MDATWNILDQSIAPTMEMIGAYIGSPQWDSLCNYIEVQYQVKPMIEYSCCSGQPGWNVKYKKAGRSLCTLYPMEGYYIALVVIGEKERERTELELPFFTNYLQQLYQDTRIFMNQKWLMIRVTNQDILEDVKQCITIRRPVKQNMKQEKRLKYSN